ncbi:MAG: chemotaxis protein CheW [Pseudomonadota bacterium]
MTATAAERGKLTLGLLHLKGQTIAIDVDALAEVAHIETLRQTVDPHPGVLGLISIRGALIPVCDPFGAYSDDASSAPPAIAAVLARDDLVIGLAVDGVNGLRRFDAGEIQSMRGKMGRGFSAGTIHRGDQMIEVIDAKTLLEEANLPSACTRLNKTHQAHRSTARPYLTFEAGHVHFAVPARNIFGTVPRQEIEDLTLADGTYLGTITYFRRRVPVMDTNRVFGLGARPPHHASETVVLRLPEDRLLGLAVDRICHVALPPKDAFRPLELRLDARMDLLSGTVELDGTEHFLIAEERLTDDSRLKNAAELSDPQQDAAAELTEDDRAVQQAKASGASAIEKLRDRFLLVDAGTQIALRMGEIRGMREPPTTRDITTSTADLPGFEGLFFSDGALVPLINLATYLGFANDDDHPRARVLMVENEGFVAGFLLDDVESIATSIWFSRQDDRISAQFDLVAVRRDGKTEVFNYLDIRAVTGRIASQWRRPALEQALE